MLGSERDRAIHDIPFRSGLEMVSSHNVTSTSGRFTHGFVGLRRLIQGGKEIFEVTGRDHSFVSPLRKHLFRPVQQDVPGEIAGIHPQGRCGISDGLLTLRVDSKLEASRCSCWGRHAGSR
jgi:hypothetical protein